MRNEMHSFASTPEANIPRSRFEMPCNIKFTGNAADLIPFYVCEVLPGDTFDVSTSLVCRLQTLIHPLMDNMYLDTYYFFCPNRLVWDNWKHFMGEPDKAWLPSQEWTVPKITVPAVFNLTGTSLPGYEYSNFKDTIIDYMGIGISAFGDPVGSIDINALPIRAYNKIYDDWFRDENLVDPINLYTGDNTLSSVDTLEHRLDPLRGGKCYKAPKLHDYFTSALPEAQRGNPPTLTMPNNVTSIVKTNATAFPRTSLNAYGLKGYTGNADQFLRAAPGGNSNVQMSIDSSLSPIIPNNLYVDMSNMSLGITVNDLRMAFQVQKFMERSARGGARYIELIKSMFGVTSPDARLQRTEYLGGHRVPINIHQIVNTAESADSMLGNVGALSVTSDVHEDFVHSFTEHGFVIGICVVRYKHTYADGLNRFWSRNTKFDYYWPVFSSIGEQPIRNKEIYLDAYESHREDVFGYQEAWADYRYMPNRVMGEMRPSIPNTLASWTLTDSYVSQPILSKEWIEEDKMPIDRAIAVTSEVADQFLFDILVNNKATRPMPLYSIPGLVDHF